MARLPSAIVGLAGTLRGMATTLWPFTTAQACSVVQGTCKSAAPRICELGGVVCGRGHRGKTESKRFAVSAPYQHQPEMARATRMSAQSARRVQKEPWHFVSDRVRTVQGDET